MPTPKIAVLALALLASGAANHAAMAEGTKLPPAIERIISAPHYAGAIWGVRVAELGDGAPLLTYGPDDLFFTGSVRKLFSVAASMLTIGPDHRFVTPVHRTGEVVDGVLKGDLVIVASGDLTLGGRTLPDGRVAFTSFDHTEANALGGAILAEPDPLQGIRGLAASVAAAGITSVEGDVVVDDRLFEHFRVPNGNVLITPVIVNENFVDVTVAPGAAAGEPAKVDWRPKSAAFTVRSEVTTAAAGGETEITLDVSPDDASVGVVRGTIAADHVPALPGVTSFVRTFTIADPTAYLRTVFIEALEAEGVAVAAAATGPNPAAKLPAPGADPGPRVAELVSPPYSEYAHLILKVSLNLGANLSLMYAGMSEGERTRDGALAAERRLLVERVGLSGNGFDFPTNGSGSPDSRATAETVVTLLKKMSAEPFGEIYFAALPILGVDGSLASIGVDPPDAQIAPGVGRVYAKTGTTVEAGALKAQVFAGYLDGKSGKRLAYVVYVNNVAPIESIAEVIKVFADEGRISAVLVEAN